MTPTFLRRVAGAVLIAFGNLIAQPVVAALNVPAAPAKPTETAESRQARALESLGDRLATAQDADIPSLLAQGNTLAAGFTAAEAGFAEVEAHLKARKLPAEILARHQAAVADYRAQRAEFQRRLAALEAAQGKATQRADALKALRDFMQAQQKQRAHTPSDPRNLPFRAPKAQTRPPIETPAGYKQSLFKPQALRLAANGSLSGITLPGTPPPATPNAQDLAETEDIQFTPAIRAKAAELGNNPVKIHNWVRNHVEFIPSYGSIQGLDLTLQTQRGNAFDTASLEIALLRAAGIPARYVYGTIQVPAAQVMNWVGGVTTPEAAQSLLGQGGIPNVAVISGGRIGAFRLEHVWVEAWVDYTPSRGAVNRQGDTWVPLDASFKQYTYTPGMDLKTQVPLDSQGLIDRIKQGATVNEQEGWVQNLNSTALQSALTDYQTRVKSYIDSAKPDATVGDVLGTKAITPHSPSILMGTLPYKTLATGAKLQSLPDHLKWQFRTRLADTWGNELAHLNQTTPTLAGKKLTLSFLPASQADLDLINSYLPQPHPGGSPIQPSELPTSLPGYLIRLKAEIRLDGQLVSQSATAVTLGHALSQASAYYNPASQQWEEGEANAPIAGEYHALALDLQGVSASQLTALKTRLEQTKAKLTQYQQNPNDPTPISTLTKEDLSGDLLYSGILGYFASVDGSDQLAAKSNGNIVAYRLPSYGTFMAKVQSHSWFGIPRSVSFPGMVMDVDRVLIQVESKDIDKSNKITFMRHIGALGSMTEHVVPERIFSDPAIPFTDDSQPVGISAVKAIALASAQGQKIFTLDVSNKDYHAGILLGIQTDVDTKQEIVDALNAGLEVTVHQQDLSAAGWSGMGYILLDPETGAGAYKISGGANGVWFVALVLGVFITLVGLLVAVAAGPWWVGAMAFAPFFALNWTFKNITLNLDACGDMLIGFVELLTVFAFAFLFPVLVSELIFELMTFSKSVYDCRRSK